MAQTQIPLQKWCYAIYLFHTGRKGISGLQLAKELRVTPKLDFAQKLDKL